MSTRNNTTVRVLLGLTVLMGILVIYVAIVVFGGQDSVEDRPAPARVSHKRGALPASPTQTEPPPRIASAALSCDPLSFALDQCPPGQVCIGGRCELDEPPRICGEGENCDDCKCSGELVCYLHRCRRQPPPPSDVCLQPTVHQSMTYLARECNRVDSDRDAILSTLSCSAQDWKKLAIDPDKLDTILAAFPDRLSFHFANGIPRGNAPLGAREREHYLNALREHREALLSAKQVLVIGRSSPDGDPKANYSLAIRRIDLVTELLREVMKSAPVPNEVPLRAWSLASESPLTPSRYRNFYAKASITATDRDDARLASLLNRELDPRYLEDWRWLYGTINRLVLVIPIPCDGTEWDPAEMASFQGDKR
ncbi:MAG TPA: hypothetical protein ENK31_01210 [Nannocystis exedens]|nr:hypothetical protein [Nannocystis exedens]